MALQVNFTYNNGYAALDGKQKKLLKYRGTPSGFNHNIETTATYTFSKIYCVTFGMQDTYFIAGKSANGDSHYDSNAAGHYKPLMSWLRNLKTSLEKHHERFNAESLLVALGPEGSCYATYISGFVPSLKERLPSALIETLDQLKGSHHPVRVQKLELGYGGSFILQTTGNRWIHRLNGRYSGLKQYERSDFANVKAVSLSPYNESDFFVMPEDLQAKYSVSSMLKPDLAKLVEDYKRGLKSQGGRQ